MTFPYHRGVAPMVWALFGLASLELVALHLLVSLKSPIIAWPLSVTTLASLVWLVRWIRSFKQCPHELKGDTLVLRMGSLRTLDIPLNGVTGIFRSWGDGEHRGKDVRNLVPVAHPNRLINLKYPLPGRGAKTRVAIRLDDPAAFDAALGHRGVVFFE